MNVDFGLAVTYNGKGYTLLSPDHVKEYPVGGLICEYCRLAPTAIKDVILACSNLDEAVTADSAAKLIVEFHDIYSGANGGAPRINCLYHTGEVGQ